MHGEIRLTTVGAVILVIQTCVRAEGEKKEDLHMMQSRSIGLRMKGSLKVMSNWCRDADLWSLSSSDHH